MTDAVYSAQSVMTGLTETLHQYLEAQYHLWDSSLIGERRALFAEPRVTFQIPMLEATPFYTAGRPYSSLEIPQRAAEALERCATFPDTGVYARPFDHQAEAIERFVGAREEIVVATGTGSGKTEAFLLPLVSVLALETAQRPTSAARRGCRALLLYPMNALVNDQLGRLRRLFGDPQVAALLSKDRGRMVQFGVYTSRTPYPGPRSKQRDAQRLDPIYAKLYADPSKGTRVLLEQQGKWPSKDMSLFAQSGYATGPLDRELFTRHEMQSTCPDILVTNYSMLEYMLIRPIERSIFDQTKEWLKTDENNFLTVVLDEAHMYRGAAGAEVALLLRRLQSRLEVDRSRLRFILTSASLGSTESAKAEVLTFAAQLTGLTQHQKPFALIKGTPDVPSDGHTASAAATASLVAFNFSAIHSVHTAFAETVAVMQELFSELKLKAFDPPPTTLQELQDAVFAKLSAFAPARLLAAEVTGRPTSFAALATTIFPSGEAAGRALESLLALATFARRKLDQRVFLPVRLHLLFRGVSGVFACINPECTMRRQQGRSLLGRLYSEPRLRCSCGGRVYELLTHRDCGAAFLRGYLREVAGDFIWHQPGLASDPGNPELLEAHLLVEPERYHATGAAKLWVHIPSGRIVRRDPGPGAFLPAYTATATVNFQGRQILSFDRECPVCLRGWRPGDTKIMDLATRGDAPFAHLVETQVKLQPATRPETPRFPNGGRKSLLFSDGRQKAARLARDIPREVEQDVFRQALVLAAARLADIGQEARLDPQHIYTAFLDTLARHNLQLFDGEDHARLLQHLAEYRKNEYANLREALDDRFAPSPPLRFHERLLRQLGNPFYSLSALTLGVVVPTARAGGQLQDSLGLLGLSDGDIEAVCISWIQNILNNMAFNEELTPGIRANANGFRRQDWGVLHGVPKKRLRRIEEVFGRGDDIDRQLLDVLAVERNGVYFVKPDKVALRLVTEKQWSQCTRCTSLTLITFRGECPNCSGASLEPLDPATSDYLRARKTFWRDPVIRMLAGVDRPFNIDVEEHTAQLSYRDYEEVSSTTEEFERRFKDILVHEKDSPIDVLSSTTTMEVGIDIGSLVAVGLRNIPPMRQNYQQRAGRAGRRGASLSTVLTYAQNNPHENHYFSRPELIISGNPPIPAIDIRNSRIIERHIHAAILQAFFHAKTRDMAPASDVFTVLGATSDFYTGTGDFSIVALEKWIEDEPEGRETLKRIDAWIPEGSPLNAHEVGRDFLQKLEAARPEEPLDPTRFKPELLEHLFAKGLLPAYAFPRDLCALQIERMEATADGRRRRVTVIERPQQSLSVALSEYAPGRTVVVNKKTYRIAAVAADSPSTEVNRAEPLFRSAKKYVHCVDCLYIQRHSEGFVDGRPCPFCGGPNVTSVSVLQPQVVFPENGREIDELDDDQVFTDVTSAQLPVPEADEHFAWEQFGLRGMLSYAPNQSLIMVNKGQESDGGHTGFAVCNRCGSTSLPADAPTGIHARHYLIERGQHGADRCNGIHEVVYLGYTLLSDILLLRIPIREPLNVALHDRSRRRPMEDALISLSETITLSACQLLDIDARELSTGVRFLRVKGETVADIFLFDTSSGGAGYSNLAGKNFREIFRNARDLLEECDCDMSCHKCLRHYGNRYSHADLNRHLGLDMWRYVAEGVAPNLHSVEEQRQIIEPLAEVLELEGWKKLQEPAVPVAIELNATRHVLGCYPSLLDPIAAGHPLEGQALLFSRYEIERNLPGAFARVQLAS